MGQSLLAERQGGRLLTKMVAGYDGTIGSDFSKQVVPLRAFEGQRCSAASSFVGGGWYSSPQGSFCIVQPACNRRVRGNHEQGLGIGQAQTRPCADNLNRELLYLAPHYRMFAV